MKSDWEEDVLDQSGGVGGGGIGGEGRKNKSRTRTKSVED
jgi:hypothetical protein